MQRSRQIEDVKKKFIPERGRCFSIGEATLSGPVTVEEERLEAAARNSARENGEQKDE